MSGEVLVVAAVIGCLGALVVLAAVVADIQESSGRQKSEHRSYALLGSVAWLKFWRKAA